VGYVDKTKISEKCLLLPFFFSTASPSTKTAHPVSAQKKLQGVLQRKKCVATSEKAGEACCPHIHENCIRPLQKIGAPLSKTQSQKRSGVCQRAYSSKSGLFHRNKASVIKALPHPNACVFL